jgi:hypothetical protein
VNLSHRWQEIAQSWLALKTWVKLWLGLLNAVFLLAPLVRPAPLVRWTLLAYVASGVLLLLIMVPQRGLTRLLGVGHLIPWSPLLVYLGVRLSSSVAGPQITRGANPTLFAYAWVLLVMVGVCLALDLRDVIRYVRGERYIMGSEAAVRAGASKPRLRA